jgi:hypothetical protein
MSTRLHRMAGRLVGRHSGQMGRAVESLGGERMDECEDGGHEVGMALEVGEGGYASYCIEDYECAEEDEG